MIKFWRRFVTWFCKPFKRPPSVYKTIDALGLPSKLVVTFRVFKDNVYYKNVEVRKWEKEKIVIVKDDKLIPVHVDLIYDFVIVETHYKDVRGIMEFLRLLHRDHSFETTYSPVSRPAYAYDECPEKLRLRILDCPGPHQAIPYACGVPIYEGLIGRGRVHYVNIDTADKIVSLHDLADSLPELQKLYNEFQEIMKAEEEAFAEKVRLRKLDNERRQKRIFEKRDQLLPDSRFRVGVTVNHLLTRKDWVITHVFSAQLGYGFQKAAGLCADGELMDFTLFDIEETQ